MSKLDIKQITKRIIDGVGGEENIISAAHCSTRLRIVLKDDSLIETDIITEIDGVKGSFNNGGQFQIILGTGLVNQVYQEFLVQTDLSEVGKEELKEIASSKLNIAQRVLKALADVFVPILPALVASGLLMGLNNLLTAEGLFVSGETVIGAYPQFADLAEMINIFCEYCFCIFTGFNWFLCSQDFWRDTSFRCSHRSNHDSPRFIKWLQLRTSSVR